MAAAGHVVREVSMADVVPPWNAIAAEGVQMVLATQSPRVHGRDVIPSLETRYRPGPAMVLHSPWLGFAGRPRRPCLPLWFAMVRHLPWLGFELDARARPWRPGSRRGRLQRQWRALVKGMIRAGFELVMEAEQRYTNSLYGCHRSFDGRPTRQPPWNELFPCT
jgi:hypothetical protein